MRLSITLAIFVLLLVPPSLAFSQSADAVTAKVDAVFAQYDKSNSPGCALGVIKDNKLVYSRGYGMANLEHGIANGPKLVYDIGSTSKQFTAASILLLAQAGKLSLEDDVRKFIPELPAYQKPILIHHLLHHTSGLRDYLGLFSLAGVSFNDTTTEADALKLIVKQKALNFTPGGEHLYSNSGYFLLSIVVKRASGRSLAEFAKENIFDPLGMKHTIYLDNHKRIVPMRATGYSPNPRANPASFQIEMSNFEQTGDGAVQTSVEDLLLWDQNFYEPKVGGKTLLEQMHATGVLNDGKKLSYAFGLTVEEYKGLRRVSHGGAWAGYRAELLRFPEQKFSVVCLCNLATANPSRLAIQVADIYLADQFKAENNKPAANPNANRAIPEAITLSVEQLADFTGSFYSEELDASYRLSVENGRLTMMNRDDAKRPLTPRPSDVFSAPGGVQLEFSRDAQGKVMGFGVNAGRIRNVRFVRQTK
jgi:CubicO group peptidase (beta-lactamase class C family)